jgi:transaldolase/glucose-6-phosphate isomerase
MVTKAKNPLVALVDHGQSVWYDYIRRTLITSGELQRLIDEDGLRGITSNPTIFEKAISGSSDYADQLEELRGGSERDPKALFEALEIRDIQDAADLLRPVWDETRGRDGYVSLEVSPMLAHDTDATVAEGRRLFETLARDNVMVKVPATPAGIPAIRALVAAGVNVNVTLLFAREVYEQVASAFVAGLEDLAAAGGDVARVASVASVFVSRIDAVIDAQLAEHAELARSAEERALAQTIAGKVAIANAKLAYQRYKQIFTGERWAALAAGGARSQRLLWASVGTKDPAYSEVLYVEELIGPETVSTIPPATFAAFRDHGRVRPSLEDDLEDTHETLATLERLGISLNEATDEVLADGVRRFIDDFNSLLGAITAATEAGPRRGPAGHSAALPAQLSADVEQTLEDWQQSGKARQLWDRDATLWTGADESHWLGWLGIADGQLAHFDQLERIARDVRDAGFEHALLLGMGGSSLCPEMLALTFGRRQGFPELRVLDSTDPAQIRHAEQSIELAKTLVIVSSKSGSTLEPNIFEEYFFERASDALGREEAARRFVAITDPGSRLEAIARATGFRHLAHGVPSIGGRYSALSNFGMVPAAIMGLDVHAFLDRAHGMAHACASCVPASENPGVVLGATIGASVARGRDKLTLIASPAIHDLGAWLEQLLAESTGKQGRGIIPVDREPLGPPEVYGQDRLFVYARLGETPDAEQDAAVAALERAGQPVVRIDLADRYDLGGEIFRWEFATAVAGALIGINPFDQPDVEASKVATRNLTADYEQRGELPAETPIASDDGLALYADERNAAALGDGSLEAMVSRHLGRLGDGDYFALLAYIEMTPEHEHALEHIRRAVRDRTRAATVAGFGPRFLHSTGQAYKGGPASGVFLQITADDQDDLPIPGHRFSFGVVKAAQARGDLEVLVQRGRRALRVHLADPESGLERLRHVIEQALQPRR